MKDDHHDAHVIAYSCRNALKEAEAMAKVAKHLEGLNSDQVRRVINAVAAMYDLDFRIPVPRVSR